MFLNFRSLRKVAPSTLREWWCVGAGVCPLISGLSLSGLLLISACSTLSEQTAPAEPPTTPEAAPVAPEATPTAPEAPASTASAPPPPSEDAASAVPNAPDTSVTNNPPAADHTVPSLLDVPDAKPRVEPIPKGGPNSPYQLKGQCYTPISPQTAYKQKGLASWYGPGFHGKRTANGEIYNMYAMTAAHKTLPLPSYVRVRNPANHKEVVLRVNDRGPFHHTRLIDLSYTAAVKLGLADKIAPVEIERLITQQNRRGGKRSASR
jgi:rare lipoprotein A (peptidoglycan hydrolase)